MRNCPLIFPFLVPSTTLPVAAVAILLAVVVEVRRVRASGGELPAAVAAVLYRAEVLDDAGDGLVGGGWMPAVCPSRGTRGQQCPHEKEHKP